MKILYLLAPILVLYQTIALGKTIVDMEERTVFMDTVKISGEEIAVVTMTDDSEFKLSFFPEDAPNTVKNFIYLAKVGFYDSLTFHRVIKDPPFVVQGGDPRGDGHGGPGYTIDAEFNSRPHLEGTVAMARSTDPNSAGSQFYICLAPQQGLDGNYTVFGQVSDGMDIVKEIEQGDVMKSVRIVISLEEGKEEK